MTYVFEREGQPHVIAVGPAPSTGGTMYEDSERLEYALVTYFFPGTGGKIGGWPGRPEKEHNLCPSYVFPLLAQMFWSKDYICEKMGVSRTEAALIFSALKHYSDRFLRLAIQNVDGPRKA